MRSSLLILTLAIALAACGTEQKEAVGGDKQPAERATRVSVAEAQRQSVEVTDSAVGRIEAKGAPMLTAEVGGRITEVPVDTGDRVARGDLLARLDAEPYRLAAEAARADVARLHTLIDNAERQLRRQQQMLAESFITQAAYDEAEAQLRALRNQLDAAQARLDAAQRDLAKARVEAPVTGIIDQRLVAAGDFVKAGQPLFRLIGPDLLRVRLPFPETVAQRLAVGQTVRLVSPLAPDTQVDGRIAELRPGMSQGRAVEAIVDVQNPGAWRPGASVRGTVVLDRRDSVLVPEAAVVKRPAGTVVYVIEGDRAQARKVTTGVLHDGLLEIRSGLQPGERVAVDGAGFLTDAARVTAQERKG